MTREEIEQLNEVEPYCFESDREEIWFKIGLQEGLKAADDNPKSPWISVKESLPPEEKDNLSAKVIVISTNNKIDFSRYDYETGGWICPESNFVNSLSHLGILDSTVFTHWMPIPEPPK